MQGMEKEEIWHILKMQLNYNWDKTNTVWNNW